MKNADFLVIGGGITGAAIAYELQKQGHQVLLLEQAPQPRNATYYSYGGVPYWAGQQPWQKQLCQEGRGLLNQLATELEGVTEYRELDLLLTLSPQDDPELIAQNFQSCWISPDYLTVDEAVAVEPLLNPEAIAGAFRVSHGHLHAEKTVHSYLQAFLRLGGKIVLEK
ncbi:MAG: NAD(P)/FAD-dependent oxidoreductase, partial [Microcystaceae cyanobacterium]